MLLCYNALIHFTGFIMTTTQPHFFAPYQKQEKTFSRREQQQYIKEQWHHYVEAITDENIDALRQFVLEDMLWHHEHNETPFYQWRLAFMADKSMARLIDLKDCEVAAQDVFHNFDLYALADGSAEGHPYVPENNNEEKSPATPTHSGYSKNTGDFKVSRRVYVLVTMACIHVFSRHGGEKEIDKEKKAIWVKLFSPIFEEFEAVLNEHLMDIYHVSAQDLAGTNSEHYQSIEELTAYSLKVRHQRPWVEKISVHTPMVFLGKEHESHFFQDDSKDTIEAIAPVIDAVEHNFNQMFLENYMALPFKVSYSTLRADYSQSGHPQWLFEFYLAEKISQHGEHEGNNTLLAQFAKALSGQLSDGWGENVEQYGKLVRIHGDNRVIRPQFDWNTLKLSLSAYSYSGDSDSESR
jgi:hypothetical protein